MDRHFAQLFDRGLNFEVVCTCGWRVSTASHTEGWRVMRAHMKGA